MMFSVPTTSELELCSKGRSAMFFRNFLVFCSGLPEKLSEVFFGNSVFENLTALMERIMRHNRAPLILGVVVIIAPVYFLKTVYTIWFGPLEVFVGFQSERISWIVLTIVDAAGFLSLLPARENGRIMQVVMFLWTIEMFLVVLATFVR